MSKRFEDKEYLGMATRLNLQWLGPLPNSVDTATSWKCEVGHELWRSYNSLRILKSCPACARTRRKEKFDYQELAVSLEMQWIGDQIPENTTKQTLWKCMNNHTFRRSYKKLRVERKCPKCGGLNRKDTEDYCRIAESLNYQWVGPIPKRSTHLTNWICNKGHKFSQSYSQLKKGIQCPECLLDKIRNPPKAYEQLAKEKGFTWIGPYVNSSKEKTKWKCKRGHVFLSRFNDIQQGYGCSYCHIKGTSRVEIRIYAELKSVFEEIEWRYKIDGIEIDIFLPKDSIAIEIDGSFWHRDKIDFDASKNNTLQDLDINIYRLREAPLEKISGNDIVYKYNGSKLKVIKKLLKQILKDYPRHPKRKQIELYLSVKQFQNQKLFKRISSYLPGPPPEKSLATLYPKIAKQWDYDKNAPLLPTMFSRGSTKIVFWKCENGHSYDMAIGERTGKKLVGCPYCSGRRVAKGESFADVYPKIAEEWNISKNTNGPDKYSPHSKKRVWWKCEHGHEWDMSIGARTGNEKQGCPYCAGKRVAKGESFADIYMHLSMEWHPTLNEKTPFEYTPMSSYSAWWKCSKGHVWQRSISARATSLASCPECREVEKQKKRETLAKEVAIQIQLGKTNKEVAIALGTSATTISGLRQLACNMGLL